MPVQRNALPTTGLLVDETEGLFCLLPCCKEICGRLTHPPQLTLSGLVEVCAGSIIHSASWSSKAGTDPTARKARLGRQLAAQRTHALARLLLAEPREK